MNKTLEAAGHCLCGAVELQAKTMNKDVGVCHCSMCRTWSGGPFFGVDCKSDVLINGIASVGIFTSSDWAERGFCKQCGTHLFYKLKQTGQYIIPAALLGREAELQLDHQIFIDEKPNYYCFANETKNMTGAEVFAAFSES